MKGLGRERYSDKDLLKALSDGNTAALESIMSRYEEQLYQFLLKILKSQELAEEVTQDVFIKLWETRHSLNKIDSIAAWTYTLGRNQAFNLLKQQAARQLREERFAKELPLIFDGRNELILREYQKKVDELVDQFPLKRREIFRLKTTHGLSNAEIASQLNISPNTVKNQLSKSFTYLRRIITERSFVFIGAELYVILTPLI